MRFDPVASYMLSGLGFSSDGGDEDPGLGLNFGKFLKRAVTPPRRLRKALKKLSLKNAMSTLKKLGPVASLIPGGGAFVQAATNVYDRARVVHGKLKQAKRQVEQVARGFSQAAAPPPRPVYPPQPQPVSLPLPGYPTVPPTGYPMPPQGPYDRGYPGGSGYPPPPVHPGYPPLPSYPRPSRYPPRPPYPQRPRPRPGLYPYPPSPSPYGYPR